MTIYNQNRYKIIDAETKKEIVSPENFILNFADDNEDFCYPKGQYSFVSLDQVTKNIEKSDGTEYSITSPVSCFVFNKNIVLERV